MPQSCVAVEPRSETSFPLAGNAVRVEAVTSPDRLDSLAQAWDELAADTHHPLPMTSCAWMASELRRGCNQDKRWVCIFARIDDRLVGVLPVLLDRRRFLPWIGVTARVPFTWHSVVSDFAVAGGEEKTVVPALLEALRRAVPGLLCLTLERAPVDSPLLTSFDPPGGRFYLVKQFESNAAYLPIAGDFGSYLGSLRKKFRTNLRRFQRKINKLDGVEYVSVTGGQGTEEHLAEFTETEASGWKGRVGSAIGASPEVTEFYRMLWRRLAERRWLEWHFLRAEGNTLAGQLGTRIGRTLVLLKIAYREDYSAYAPGNLLLARTFEQAFASGEIDEINCLTEYPWTHNWNMQVRPHYKVDVYPKTPAGIFLGLAPRRAKLLARQVPWLAKPYRAICRHLEAEKTNTDFRNNDS